jgi:hypothetical protein
VEKNGKGERVESRRSDSQAFVITTKSSKQSFKVELAPAEIMVGDSVGTEPYGNSEHVSATRLKEAAGPHYRNFSRTWVVELQVPFKQDRGADVMDADVYIPFPK